MSMKLFVGNLRYEMSARELRDLFSPYDCSEAVIMFDPHTHDSRGFGYVVVADNVKAIADLDGQEYNGRKLHVEAARPERPKAEFNFERKWRAVKPAP